MFKEQKDATDQRKPASRASSGENAAEKVENLVGGNSEPLMTPLGPVRFGLATFFFLGMVAFSGVCILPSYCKQPTWFVFRYSADPATQRMIRTFCSSLSLIVLDVQLQVSMIILVMDTGVYLSTFDICVTVVGATTISVWVWAGIMARNKESTCWLVVFGILWLTNVAYIIFRMQEIVRQTPRESWSILRHIIIVCGSIALVTRLAAAFCMIRVARNFGNGINEKMLLTKEQRNTARPRQLEMVIPEGAPDKFVP